MTNTMKITLKTLTPLWTGGVDGEMDRVHETGIIGSLRWWYEALVRGLGGWACDPTADRQRCPDQEGQRCTACELFGCTGWQRKFKLQILNEQGNLLNEQPDPRTGLREGTVMTWRFLELRPLETEEKWLLYQAIRIASEYGAIGGRTPRKPQSNKLVGGDYGLFEITGHEGTVSVSCGQVVSWLKDDCFRRGSHSRWPDLPDLRWFFFISGQCLWRKQINALIGLSEDGKSVIANGEVERALRGCVGVSKKVFSFETDSARRLWGYAPDAEVRDMIVQRLKEFDIESSNIRTGEKVLNEL